MNIEEVLCRALQQKGDRYVFGAEVPLTAQDGTAWDCSELVQWATKGIMPDGAYYQWRACRGAGTMVSVATGMKTRGALLFVGDGTGVGRDAITHVAISLGDGTTIEARGRLWGVGCWAAAGRFQWAAKMPGINYAVRPYVTPPPPAAPPYPGRMITQPPLYAGPGVSTLQRRLRDLGYQISVDGVYGPGSEKVVRAFQSRKRLVVDGNVGPKTWAALWK